MSNSPTHPWPWRISRPSNSGFSLVELMITVLIISILAAVALPSYQRHVMKSRRADAISALSSIAQAQERWRSNNSTYASTLSDLGQAQSTTSGYYALSLVGVGDPAGFTSGYEVHAVPNSSGAQAHDSDCTDIFIQVERGQLRYRDTNSASTPSSAVCWPQ